MCEFCGSGPTCGICGRDDTADEAQVIEYIDVGPEWAALALGRPELAQKSLTKIES